MERLCLFYDLSVMAFLVFSFFTFFSAFLSFLPKSVLCQVNSAQSWEACSCVHGCVHVCVSACVCACVCMCVHIEHVHMPNPLTSSFPSFSHYTLVTLVFLFFLLGFKLFPTQSLSVRSSPLEMASKNTRPEVGPFAQSFFIINLFLLFS